jgi:hypothetical protein
LGPLLIILSIFTISVNQFHTIIFQISGEAAWHNLQKILAPISYNVPAVYDVFAVAIKETVGFQQPQKCGGETRTTGVSPTAVFRSPSPLPRRSIYSPVMRSKNQLRSARHGRRAGSFFVHIFFYFHAIFIFFECIAQSDKYKFIKF